MRLNISVSAAADSKLPKELSALIRFLSTKTFANLGRVTTAYTKVQAYVATSPDFNKTVTQRKLLNLLEKANGGGWGPGADPAKKRFRKLTSDAKSVLTSMLGAAGAPTQKAKAPNQPKAPTGRLEKLPAKTVKYGEPLDSVLAIYRAIKMPPSSQFVLVHGGISSTWTGTGEAGYNTTNRLTRALVENGFKETAHKREAAEEVYYTEVYEHPLGIKVTFKTTSGGKARHTVYFSYK